MSDPAKLTLIVGDEAMIAGGPEAKPEDFEEHFGRPKDVDIDKLQDGLQRVQGQVDKLLEGVNQSTVGGFRLNSIDVSLAISAKGSIGIASAGVMASMSLSFKREDGLP
jgi:X-X-X-Leu-X-X-Gly heptad repeat protein